MILHSLMSDDLVFPVVSIIFLLRKLLHLLGVGTIIL